MKFYQHNNYDHSEIDEMVKKAFPDKSRKFHMKLSEQIYGYFYEVEFEIHTDAEGNLTEVVMVD